MGKLILAIVVTCLLGDSVRAGTCPTQGSTASGRTVDWVKILRRVQGRVVGSLIRNGITDEEVVRILGCRDQPLPTGGVVGGVLFTWRQYDDYGLTISLTSVNGGDLLVTSVTFRPLFD